MAKFDDLEFKKKRFGEGIQALIFLTMVMVLR